MVFTNFFKKLIPKTGNRCYSRSRTKQRKYREELIKKFKVCPLDNLHPSLCEAAHILPHGMCKKTKNKFDVDNGILLSCNMHKAFDRHLFTIDENNCKVKILENNILKLQDNQKLLNLKEFGLDKIENKYISLLDNEKSKKFLKKRNKLVKEGKI